MFEAPDILAMAYKQPVMQDQLVLLQEKDRQIPGSVQYSIKRYAKHPQWNIDDMGMMVYHFRKEDPTRNYLELRFCIAGNTYYRRTASERIGTVDVFSFRFLPVHLSQFVRFRKPATSVSESLLEFRHTTSFSKTLSLCGRTRLVLETLLSHNYTGSHANIFVNAQSQMLLLYSMECMVGEKEVEGFQCKFLANEADREKIVQAREILLQHIGEPLTIRELSRKVAINECYLKKGFKEMFGTTIFDFYQGQRMEHARYLLYEKGLSVTDVSLMLGYSSISHFSTAFKKHTGLKPCELLLH
jgi:AraC family transcriptional regulator